LSDVDPANLSLTRRSASFEDSDEDLTEPPPKPKPEREGLPPNFRMRADRHYVESLTDRGARARTDAPSAATAAVVQPVSRGREDARPAKPALVLAQVAHDLAAIEESAAVFVDAASPIARRVNGDVIRAHAWRAFWIVGASELVERREPLRLRRQALGELLTGVRDRFLPECRLAGIVLDVQVSEWEATITADTDGLGLGIAGAIFATMALVESLPGSVIRVSGVVGGDARTTIEVSQSDVAAPRDVDRMFDASWTDRPGGWFAAMGCAAARAVAEQHGGEALFLAGKLGSTLRLTLDR